LVVEKLAAKVKMLKSTRDEKLQEQSVLQAKSLQRVNLDDKSKSLSADLKTLARAMTISKEDFNRAYVSSAYSNAMSSV